LQISKRSPFDFAIIGTGISGACMAYHLDKLGKSVIVIEKDKIASGGSGAAGAFLSPKLASNSPYTKFINSSFEFSIKFYKENFPKFLKSNGILRILKSQDDIDKCRLYEDILPKNFTYLRADDIEMVKKDVSSFGGYFFKDGATIDSVGVIKEMLKVIDVVDSLHVESFDYINGYYEIGDIRAKGIVFCAGNSQDFKQLEYLGLKNIYGHRIDVKTATILPFHLHKSCSISASHDGLVHIGATHIPNYKYDKNRDYDVEVSRMIELAKSYLKFDGFEVKKVNFGVRNSSLDFFPTLGQIVDVKKTLEKYPYIKKGSKVPKEKYIYYPNLFVHAGLGARGFVLAPITSKILSEHICTHSNIPKRLETQRLFVKFAKKQKSGAPAPDVRDFTPLF